MAGLSLLALLKFYNFNNEESNSATVGMSRGGVRGNIRKHDTTQRLVVELPTGTFLTTGFGLPCVVFRQVNLGF